MAAKTRDPAASEIDQAIGRIREVNDRIVASARRGGEASLQAYERLLKIVADAQEAAGDRGAAWVKTFTAAQARFTRELADALPAAARSALDWAAGPADKAVRPAARRLHDGEPVEGEVWGAVAREQDLPIPDYDQLTASQIVTRLEPLREAELRKIEVYERKHANRKTVHDKIKSLTR
jgi:hypothetical protein